LDVEGETTVSAIYRFARSNGVCVGLVLNDRSLLRPIPKTRFENTTVGKVLRAILPRGYRMAGQGRVVVIQPFAGAPSWLSQTIPRFRVEHPVPVRVVVFSYLTMSYELARDPARKAGFVGDVGYDPTNTIGPLDERNRTVLELLNLIAERSRGAMWVGLSLLPRWEFIEFQRPEDWGVRMLRPTTDLIR
jgi:hypothetical protein